MGIGKAPRSSFSITAAVCVESTAIEGQIILVVTFRFCRACVSRYSGILK
jgi:hypothetical protein